jgi:hypothetical protein
MPYIQEIILVAKFICLYLIIYFGFINVARVIHGTNITENHNFLMALGIAGFITLQWLI